MSLSIVIVMFTTSIVVLQQFLEQKRINNMFDLHAVYLCDGMDILREHIELQNQTIRLMQQEIRGLQNV